MIPHGGSSHVAEPITQHQKSKARQESSHPDLEAPSETQPASTCSVKVKGNGESHTEGIDVSLCVVFLRHGDCTRDGDTSADGCALGTVCIRTAMQRQLPGNGSHYSPLICFLQYPVRQMKRKDRLSTLK